MQLHLDGSTAIAAPRESVYRLLTSTQFLAKTLPEAEEVKVVDDNIVEAKLKVKVAVVSTTLKVRLTIADRVPPTGATLLAEGSGSGSAMKVRSSFTLSGDGPTNLAWSADADVSGVMSGLGSSLLKGFATKKVAEIFGGITKGIETQAGTRGGTA